jgi:hypothetical protein
MNGMFHPRKQYPGLSGRSVPLDFLKLVTFNKWLPTSGKVFNEFSIVPDPEQDPDPYVFGPHGSTSVIYTDPAPECPDPSINFLSLTNDVNVP